MNSIKCIHTSNPRRADELWCRLGGAIQLIDGTGEKRYTHKYFQTSLRTNARRNDVPAKLLTRLNQLLRRVAANDAVFGVAQQLR